MPNDFGGVVGGAQIGYNHQFSPWLVLGVEADIQGTNLDAGAAGGAASLSGANFALFDANHFVDYFGTVRGRIGMTPFLDGRLLIYGTGGFAWGKVTDRFTKADLISETVKGDMGGTLTATGSLLGNTVFSDIETGWTAGGGVEWAPAFLPNVSAKVEYLFVDLGSRTLAMPGVLASGAFLPGGAFAGGFFVAEDHVRTRFHVVRAGVNYHVNLFAPAPTAASY